MPKGDKDKSIRCSFCGKGQDEVEELLLDRVYIYVMNV